MEHSSLHALQLCGIVVAFGGPFLMLAVFFPACRAIHNSPLPTLADTLPASVSRWVFISALVAGVAAFLNLFVDVAEARNQTIFGGVSLGEVWRFATMPFVGRLYSANIVALLLTAAAARLPGKSKWWFSGLFALVATGLASLISHAAAQPTGQVVAVAFQLAHVSAAGIWLGGLIHLLLARSRILDATDAAGTALIAQTVKRFSPIAFTAVLALGVSGAVAAVRYLVTPAAVPTSAYGLTLTLKLLLIIPLLYAGFMNFRVIRPRLLAVQNDPKADDQARGALLRRFGKFLELEVTLGVLVVLIAGIVASISPPANVGNLRLTSAQWHALLSPDLPTTAIVSPETFYGAAERTVDDLRYAEFTHNWSGVMVCVLGLCWLVQSLGGRFSRWAERAWPVCLAPFALFILVAADPEVWLMRKVSYLEAISDPSVLEHQFSALLVFILVWLGWRDRHHSPDQRPLGYALPLLMMLGSLLLLGHAHSNLNTSQELTNLINVQHAVFGTFGLGAGIIRWLSLRGLFPNRIARVAWPGLVLALGLFMTFFYREVV